jgi:transposase-like protein
MADDTITQLPDPSGFGPDPFTDVLRDGARKLIEQAIHAELAALMAAFSGERLDDGRARLVRHGHLPEREVMTGIGPVPVKVPRVRDRKPGEDRITFTPSILPRYLRRAKSIEELLPWLYLKGVSTGDFTEALEALLGPNAKGLSAKTVTRLKADWWTAYEAWQKRDLGARRFLYIWADGVYFKPRMAEEKQCVLVIVGADEYGRKELLAMTPLVTLPTAMHCRARDGFRESTQSWREVLLDLKRRGLKQDPKLAIGDGALGFWAALREVFPTTQEQRCWLHKTMNVLNALPKSVQAKAKAHLHDIWQADTKADANVAFDFFVEAYGVKWDKAVAKLTKDRDALLTFYDFPAEHWKHIRTSNPIESTFATVRHRTKRTKGCLSRKTGLAMAFKLMMSAQKKWRRLDGQNRLPEVIAGVEFRDGLRNLQTAA